MAGQKKKIAELSEWAADPEKMARFEQVALLSQRTGFIKTILCLPDQDDLILQQIQVICRKHEVPCKIPRGSGFDQVYLKALGPEDRYAISILLSTLLQCGDAGLTSTTEGMSNTNLVDRMIFSYRKYLKLFLLPVADAPVSFEMFYHLYKLYQSGDIDVSACLNCDSSFVNLRVTQSIKCPLCQTHRHAELKVGRAQSESNDVEVRTLRRAAG